MNISGETDNVFDTAKAWVAWCGETSWSKYLYRFGELGGKMIWWGGYPQSVSAIPLCFQLFTPNGIELECNSRLKDIKAAIKYLENNQIKKN